MPTCVFVSYQQAARRNKLDKSQFTTHSKRRGCGAYAIILVGCGSMPYGFWALSSNKKRRNVGSAGTGVGDGFIRPAEKLCAGLICPYDSVVLRGASG
jgi:hypothetical protein